MLRKHGLHSFQFSHSITLILCVYLDLFKFILSPKLLFLKFKTQYILSVVSNTFLVLCWISHESTVTTSISFLSMLNQGRKKVKLNTRSLVLIFRYEYNLRHCWWSFKQKVYTKVMSSPLQGGHSTINVVIYFSHLDLLQINLTTLWYVRTFKVKNELMIGIILSKLNAEIKNCFKPRRYLQTQNKYFKSTVILCNKNRNTLQISKTISLAIKLCWFIIFLSWNNITFT